MYCSNTLKMGKGCDCRLIKLFRKFVLLVKQKMGIFLVKIVGFFLIFAGPNQVQTFLTEHGGPGIQHIGLHTPNITEAVAALKESGVKFIDPPSAYYSEVCKPYSDD